MLLAFLPCCASSVVHVCVLAPGRLMIAVAAEQRAARERVCERCLHRRLQIGHLNNANGHRARRKISGLPLRLLRRCLLHSCFLHVAWTLQRSYHELSWYSLSSLSSSSCSFSSSLSVSVMSRIQRSSTAPLCSHAPGSLAKPEDLDCPFRLVAGLSQRCPQCT